MNPTRQPPPAPTVLCDECGSAMVLSVGPGRMRDYRGRSGYELPADLAFPRCPECGAEWMTSSQIDRLSEHLERQRRRRIRAI